MLYQIMHKNNEKCFDLEDLIIDIEEYDLPFDISFLSKQCLRCGKFYEVCYSNEEYEINEIDIITMPQLTIFAFDIETTKQPLKFPCAETDQVMMISFMINDAGYLINNREFINDDVQSFQYKIAKNNEEETIEFRVINCKNEVQALHKFNEILKNYKPDIITTYNGDFFDMPFLEKRFQKHNIENLLVDILHLDCFKWVKRDSYLPMGSQGLKAVTKAKLGYFPDEVDPELMMWYGKNDPEKLCVYSVSDAVATYNLYTKYVNPFIFSLCTLIPLSPFDVLNKGSGTLCESLLVSEALQKNVLIPPKRIPDDVYFEGRYCNETTYIGGHVECLKSGIYRSDFEYVFKIKQSRMQDIMNLVPEILAQYSQEENFTTIKDKINQDIINFCEMQPGITNDQNINNTINITTNPLIYHLDVAAMYPNIILTNRLQPNAVIGKETCIRCDYYTNESKCQKNMKWQMRVEYYMPDKFEIESIKQMLQTKKNYQDGTDEMKEKIFKEYLSSYSKDIYKKTKETKVCKMENIVCQRENPFYVDVVQKFRDKRYELKNIQKRIENEIKTCTKDKQELQKKIIIYESLQVAHKCILNSFYGYVMRKNSRWYSMEMAAIVCNTGSKIIKLAKELIDDIGIPLELDTDGIWCLIPKTFPNTYQFASGKKMYFICEILNLLVKNKFTNYQYHKISDENVKKAAIIPKNEIVFEIDGPYKAMVLPASTEEGKLIKKKYLVINNEGKISELKGFEYKRRGELKIVKKFQEDLFSQFLEGNTLKECYTVLKETCMYYLNIIKSKGRYLSDNDIFELLSESKNMSKEFDEYEGRKTTSTSTANKLSELLGEYILQEKGLKCQYIIAKYPSNAPITERTVPIAIFQTDDMTKRKYIKKWLKTEEYTLKKIIDWDYYKDRLVNVMLKIIILPGILQGLGNLISEIEPPKWARKNKNKSLFDFSITKVAKKETGNEKENLQTNFENFNAKLENKSISINNNYKKFVESKKIEWKDFFVRLLKTYVIEIEEKNKTILQCKRFLTLKNEDNFKISFTLKKYITLEDYLEKFTENTVKKKILENTKQNNNEYEFECNNEYAQENKIEKIFNNFYIENVTKQTVFDLILENSTNNFDLENNLDIFCILPFDFSGHKYFFCKTKLESFVITEHKSVNENNEIEISFIVANIYNYLKQIRKNNVVYFLPKNDVDLTSFLIKSNKKYVILANTTNVGLKNFKATVKDYTRILQKFYSKSLCLIETSIKFNIPFLNLSKMCEYDFLDFLYYRELKISNLQSKQAQVYDFLDNFSIEKGYFQNFCVSVEIKNSMINTILNEKKQYTHNNEPNSYIYDKISVLKKIVKNIKNSNNVNNFYIANVINCFDRWVKIRLKDDELKNYLIYKQKIYLNDVMNKLKNFGAKIIHYNNEFVMFETMKVTKKSCEEYLSFVIEKMKHNEIETLNVFKKVALVDVFNFYYNIESIEENKTPTDLIFTNNEKSIPTDFLELFFSNKMSSNYFYDLILKKYRNKEIIIKMLDLYETYKNVDKLRSSCYNLLNINAFTINEEVIYKQNISCENCNFDGSLFFSATDISVCFKCLENHSSAILDNLFCKMIFDELKSIEYVCDECNTIKVHIITKKCKCGGVYTKNIDYEKISTMHNHITNEDKKEMISKVIKR